MFTAIIIIVKLSISPFSAISFCFGILGKCMIIVYLYDGLTLLPLQNISLYIEYHFFVLNYILPNISTM